MSDRTYSWADLLPCPFCGEDMADFDENCDGTHVACDECGAQTVGGSDKREAIDDWNRRALSSSGAGQSRRHSVLESVANVLVGYGVAIVAQRIVLPLFGVRLGIGQDFGLAGVMTVVSLVRSYLLRRAFNGWQLRATEQRTP